MPAVTAATSPEMTFSFIIFLCFTKSKIVQPTNIVTAKISAPSIKNIPYKWNNKLLLSYQIYAGNNRRRTKADIITGRREGVTLGKIFAALYDPLMKPLELFHMRKIRKKMLQNVSGRVLEIGSGTGLNFAYYPEDTEEVQAVEPDGNLRERSLPRSLRSSVPIYVKEGTAEKLPFKSNSFDAVINTLVFCTIEEPEQALKEIIRVTRPGGKVLFYEHVRPSHPAAAKMSDKLTPAWKAVCGGCHLNRDTEGIIRRSGLDIVRKENMPGSVFIRLKARVPEK